jgi:hypothetical protein
MFGLVSKWHNNHSSDFFSISHSKFDKVEEIGGNFLFSFTHFFCRLILRPKRPRNKRENVAAELNTTKKPTKKVNQSN